MRDCMRHMLHFQPLKFPHRLNLPRFRPYYSCKVCHTPHLTYTTSIYLTVSCVYLILLYVSWMKDCAHQQHVFCKYLFKGLISYFSTEVLNVVHNINKVRWVGFKLSWFHLVLNEINGTWHGTKLHITLVIFIHSFMWGVLNPILWSKRIPKQLTQINGKIVPVCALRLTI